MNWKKHLVICLILYVLMQVVSYAAKPDYATKNLANGAKVVYKVLPLAKTVTVRIVFPAGFLTEPHALRGISHLVERLIYRGNERVTPVQFHRLTDDRGGSYSSFTTFNRTEYLLEVLPEDLIPALRAYMDLIMQPGFAEQSIAIEKKITTVEKEMNTVPGNTFFIYLNELSEKQFHDSASDISREDLIRYHQLFYRPDLSTIIITGAFNTAEVFKLFADIPVLNLKPNMEMPLPLPRKDIESDIVLNDYLQGEQYQLLIGFDLQQLSGKELLVAKVLPYILNYETHQYDYLTDRPLDYRIFLFNLNDRCLLVFQYRDCSAKYSPQLAEWHRKNLERYFKYLEATNLSAFLNSLAGDYDRFFEILEHDTNNLSEFYDKILFDRTTISFQDASAIRRLSANDFKAFTRKYLQGRKYHKIVINAL